MCSHLILGSWFEVALVLQDPLVSPFAIWAASQSKLEFECSEQSADDVSTGAKSEHQEVSSRVRLCLMCVQYGKGGDSATILPPTLP